MNNFTIIYKSIYNLLQGKDFHESAPIFMTFVIG